MVGRALLLPLALWSLVGAHAGAQSQAERVQRAQGLPPVSGGDFGPLGSPERAQDARAVLDLMVTVRVLAELADTLPAAERRTAAAVLAPLRAAPTLGPVQARDLQGALLGALTPAAQVRVAARRAALERQAQALLTRARLARPLHPADGLLRVYGLLVPGGQALVRRLYDDPQPNPYREDANRRVLEQVLRGPA